MTEQEARIKRLKVFMYAEKVKLYNGLFDDLNECIKALEKQIAKKPIWKTGDFINRHHCPCCNEIVWIEHPYCECGQKLDWGNEDDRD